MLKNRTLAGPDKILLGIIRQTVFQYLAKQRKYFGVIIGVIVSAILGFKLATHELHSVLLPMGIVLGLVMAIGIESSLAIIWSGTLQKSLVTLKDDPTKSRTHICTGTYAAGLWVAGLILVSMSLWFGWVSWVLDVRHGDLFRFLTPIRPFQNATETNEFRLLEFSLAILAPSFSAGLYALFSRVSTGIFAKTADLSADITGRTEFDLPEDDLRNPAVIADLAGDILSSVSTATAVVQAVLFSVCVTAVIGLLNVESLAEKQWHHVATIINMPLNLLGFSVVAAALAMPILRWRAVVNRTGAFIPITGVLTVCLSWILAPHYAVSLTLGVSAGVILLMGLGIWVVPFSPAIKHSVAAHRVHAINGLFSGFAQAALGLIPACIGLGLLFFEITRHFFAKETWLLGIFKLGLATTGMLSLVTTVLMLGGFAAIADILKGCAEMLGLSVESRKLAAKNDADGTVGSTVLKTYLITSTIPVAVMTACLLVYRLYFYGTLHGFAKVENVTLHKLGLRYELFLNLPSVWMGILTGCVLCFLATGGIIFAVQRTSRKLTENIRRQLSESNQIWTGEALPDYESANVEASRTALISAAFIITGVFTVPVIVTAGFGLAGAIGFIMGLAVTSYVLGLFFNLMGSLWRITKKRIEEESGIQSTVHVAAVFTDSIGDILKDALAPSYAIMANLCGIILVLVISMVLK